MVEHSSFHLTNLEPELKPSKAAEKSTELSNQMEKKKGLLRSSTSPGAMWFVGVDEQVNLSNDSQASAATFANNLMQNLESSLNNPNDILQKSSKFTAPLLSGDTSEVSSDKNNISSPFLPSSYTKVSNIGLFTYYICHNYLNTFNCFYLMLVNLLYTVCCILKKEKIVRWKNSNSLASYMQN